MSTHLTGILGSIGMFLIPAVTIILIIWFKTKASTMRERLQAYLYAKVIEKGIELPQLPPSFFTQEKAEKKRNPLNIGIICIATGLGVSLFFVTTAALLGDEKISRGAATGIIPFFIGIACLLIWFIERKQVDKQDVE